MNYTIGSDPEVFLSRISNGKIASGIGLFGGTKDEPLDIGSGCACQEDNILVEFNIPAVKTKEDFKKYINYGKDYISTVAAGYGLKPHYSSSEIVDEEIISEEAKIFGCDPSINVISKTVHQIDPDAIPQNLKLLRTSGFHIHIGLDFPSDYKREKLVMAFELMTTLPLVDKDNDCHHRRQFYGMFGDCRFKDYGVECRSLGGYFLRDDDSIDQVWKGVENTIKLFESDIKVSSLWQMLDYCIEENNIPNLSKFREITNDLYKSKTIKLIK